MFYSSRLKLSISICCEKINVKKYIILLKKAFKNTIFKVIEVYLLFN